MPFAAYPSVVVYKTPVEKSKRNAVTHLIWGDLIKELGPREGEWVKIHSRRKFGWIHKRDLQEIRNPAKQLDLAEKESDKEAIRKKLEKKMAELERSIAVYGMINVRTDGEKAIIAQKLERPRSKAEKWDIYELKQGPDGRLAYAGHSFFEKSIPKSQEGGAMKPDKVIVTNRSALKEKYDERFGRIEQGIQRLIAADQKRGLDTKLVAIDSETDMGAVHGEAVKDKEDQRAVKKAVDALFDAYEPDYIMILGAQDIVPHQDLKNPAYDPGGDDDKVVPSDIPYACEAPYSTRPGDFVGPTRVVGRIPDLVRSSDPAYLVSLLGTAARHRTRFRSEYQKYFSVSAEVWKASTALSLTKIFGSSASMATSPPKGPSWKSAELGRRVHFINCHGSPEDPNFYGQRGGSYPIAHTAAKLVKKIMNGTVIAVECCYGAQLYDPADADMEPGICSTYLRDGAYGFFGSSTIAYGPSEGNGQADLICQYFIEEVLDGASLGEATLKARHRFAQAYTHVDPTDLKTMIQFHLFGDPSIHPVGAVPHALARTKAFKQAFRKRQNTRGTRRLRRERAARTGTNLWKTLGTPNRSDENLPSEVKKVLESIAQELGMKSFGAQSFTVDYPGEAMVETMKRFAPVREGRALYMVSGSRPLPKEAPGRVVVITGTVQSGQLIHLRCLHSR